MSIIDQWSGWQGRLAGVVDKTVAAARPNTVEVVDLLKVPQGPWAELAGRAIEPNGFYHPAWACAVSRHAEGKSGARVLLAWDGPARNRLIGLLPVVSAWHALRLPIPVFVAWQAYSPLTTPLLDRDKADEAARGLMVAARHAGAMALLLPQVADAGPAAGALRRAVASLKAAPYVFDRHQRARLDATQDGDAAIAALGSKKVKELRRQRHRLADAGEVRFKIAAPGFETGAALAAFLKLEAAGWKGANGTALACQPGDAQFIKTAVTELTTAGAAQVATLSVGATVVAAGVLVRHLRRGYFFKIAYDEALAKTSPGVQLTLDVTRHFCADGAIDDVDSTAVSGHPMIDHIWRGRLSVADLLLPVEPGKPTLAIFAASIGARRLLRGTARAIFHCLRSMKGQQP